MPSPVTSPFTPNAFGIDGPVTSASSIATLCPRRFIITDIIDVTIDLPTPPLPLTTPITFLIWESSCGFSMRLSLVRDEQFAEQVEQSCLHSDCSVLSVSIESSYIIGITPFIISDYIIYHFSELFKSFLRLI